MSASMVFGKKASPTGPCDEPAQGRGIDPITPPNMPGRAVGVPPAATSGSCRGVTMDASAKKEDTIPFKNFQIREYPGHKKKENKKLPIRYSNQIEDCKITDVEEFRSASNQPVPMSPEQTGSVLSDKNQREEVEMEDIFEDPVTDIDRCDAKNSLAVVDYVGVLYAYYREMEAYSCVPPDYMSQQLDINEKMRAILIDWIIEVHYRFELREETLFLTVNLIDRFLSRESVLRKKLQLVGLVAVLLACKYEEVSVPIVPIKVEINHGSEVDEIFDAISYMKGASVIRMLQSYIGAECFQNYNGY